MTKDILILGLGKFGGQLAKALASKGVRVHGVDQGDILEAHHACLYAKADIDLTSLESEQALQELFTKFDVDFNAAVVSLGSNEALATSTTMALFDMPELPVVLVKAVDAMHESVLLRLGDSAPERLQVVIPERFAAGSLANSLADDAVESDIQLNDSVGIREIHCPKKLIGKMLKESGLRDDKHVNVVALRIPGATPEICLPTAETVLAENCMLFVAGLIEHLDELSEK